MNIKKIHTLILVLLCYVSIAQENNTSINIELKTIETEFNTKDSIVLKFKNASESKPTLYCSNSYGSTLVTPEIKQNILLYKIPKNISTKVGAVTWNLLYKNNSINGKFNVTNIPNKVKSMETYLGPPSIQAGKIDYTMIVVIPTDSLDNPLPENTPVTIKHQFQKKIKNQEVITHNLIAYKNIYSENDSGKILVSSESRNTNSKEFTITVYPAIPSDFQISAQRVHDYADGNQITTFNTTVIKDKNGNIVADGTYVNFLITNKNGVILKTSGSTIQGVATSKILHPDEFTKWNIKAFVNGIAESQTINLEYKQAVKELDVTFSENNRKITVGKIESFMGQVIPDGLQVKLNIFKNDTLIETKIKTSRDGYAEFILKQDQFKNDTYKFVVEVSGIEKSFNTIKLW